MHWAETRESVERFASFEHSRMQQRRCNSREDSCIIHSAFIALALVHVDTPVPGSVCRIFSVVVVVVSYVRSCAWSERVGHLRTDDSSGWYGVELECQCGRIVQGEWKVYQREDQSSETDLSGRIKIHWLRALSRPDGIKNHWLRALTL